jgi:hypothetical protein
MADIPKVEITKNSLKYYIEGKKLPILIEFGHPHEGGKERWFCYRMTTPTTKGYTFYDSNSKQDCIRYVKKLIKSL